MEKDGGRREGKEEITKGGDTVANDVDDSALRRDSWHPENEVEDNDEDLSTLRVTRDICMRYVYT